MRGKFSFLDADILFEKVENYFEINSLRFWLCFYL